MDMNGENRISLLYYPIVTMKYFVHEIVYLFQKNRPAIRPYQKYIKCSGIFLLIIFILYALERPQSSFIHKGVQEIIYLLKWNGLGILSSIGLGFGFHTFVLYLAPFIASVTMAAWECNSVRFPPPYPHKITCPTEPDKIAMNIWKIALKVKMEAFAWGLGTAIGELPPYLLAFASQATSECPTKYSPFQSNFLGSKIKKLFDFFIRRVGFLGIIFCASIPNPLFDFAGITCGLYRVSFWTFFGATIIGKSIIKVTMMGLFVIFCFSPKTEHLILNVIRKTPLIGRKVSKILNETVESQKFRFHPEFASSNFKKINVFQVIINCAVVLMILYIIISTINSLARSHLKRISNNNS
uniref:Vacuole membrane protein 1 (Trinotate prediction) n=1 Tax=Myxobolus squamalis TaxID=59785 RepID=A0A6B2G0Y5_MYXSQ